MAVIQKIRNKYGKVAGGVIALSLVAFILMDAASGRFGDLFGRDNSVVKINGEKVDEKEYSARLKDYEALYEIYSGKTLDEATRAQLNEQAMNELINEKLVDEQCEKLGIGLTADEEKEIIYGANADQMIQNFKLGGQDIFSNPETHHFDPQRVKAFEKQVKENDKTGKTLEGWEALKAYVIRNAKVSKFNAIMMGCVYTPKFLIDNMTNDQRQLANISFVKIPFTAINDNEVKVTDDDLLAYMKKNPAKYEVKEASRSIEYVSFDLTPMTEDTAKSLGELIKIKPAFDTVSAKDIESFVNRNSNDQYQDAYVSKKAFPSQYADTVFSKPVGAVYGPYYEAGVFRMVKIIDKKEVADSVKCRHILVKTKDQRAGDMRTDSAAKKRLDSAVAEIKAGADFKTVAAKYTDDSASLAKNGEYEFTYEQKSGISKEFGDFIFDGKKGETKTVHVENGAYAGYHYIEILDQKAFGPVAKLAIISKPLEAGQQTDRIVFARANEFAGKNTTGEAFDAAVKAGHLDKRNADNIKPESYTIQGLGSSREIIRWAYDHKVGEVSPVFNMEGKYIVAKVSAIQDKGMPALTASNRPMIENAVKMDKKAELIKNKYKGMASLEALAQAAGQQPQEADSVTGNASFIPKVGYAPKVVGYVFYKGLQPNTLSPGIQAGDGVYFIKLLNRWEKPADPMATMMMGQQKMMMEMQSKNAMSTTLRDMLKNQAKIKFTVNNI
ncbi:MAG: SurA N-terminal domain-containing protein [Bacteroidetes bacterium]|nr:SurA N-terminal domain-containing protein [Bacteroidota bacterium]